MPLFGGTFLHNSTRPQDKSRRAPESTSLFVPHRLTAGLHTARLCQETGIVRRRCGGKDLVYWPPVTEKRFCLAFQKETMNVSTEQAGRRPKNIHRSPLERSTRTRKMKVRQAIKLIEDDGWFLVRTPGSHRRNLALQRLRKSAASRPIPSGPPQSMLSSRLTRGN